MTYHWHSGSSCLKSLITRQITCCRGCIIAHSIPFKMIISTSRTIFKNCLKLLFLIALGVNAVDDGLRQVRSELELASLAPGVVSISAS